MVSQTTVFFKCALDVEIATVIRGLCAAVL